MERRTFLKLGAAVTLAGSFSPAIADSRNGMPYRILGRTGEKVSLLGVGGYHIGKSSLSESESIRMMRFAIDEGVNFFDNAWEYNNGRSEELMGKALRDGYRDKVLYMTKVLGRTREEAQKQLDESLKRFGHEVIDLWQIHGIRDTTDIDQVFNDGAMAVALEAQKAGKVRHIGFTGHFDPAAHLKMLEKDYPWASVQMPLNVFDHHDRSFEKNVLPRAVEKNVGVIAMKTQAFGAIPRTGAVTSAECLRYVFGLPISTLVSGMDSEQVLKENIETARAFRPYSEEEKAELLARTRSHALEERHEEYKKPANA